MVSGGRRVTGEMKGSLPHHVLHVLHSPSGGTALSTLGLVEGLALRNIQSSMVCGDAGTREERQRIVDALSGRVKFVPLYLWHRKIRSAHWKRPLLEMRQWLSTGARLRTLGRIQAMAMAVGADLIHTSSILTPDGAYVARRMRLPHVWHVRELVGPGRPFRLPGEGGRLGKFLSRSASVLIANSQATANSLVEFADRRLVQVVPNGIDVSAFSPRSVDANQTTVVVGMVANLSARWKKHALFVEAAARVDRSLQVVFRLYGDDPSHGGSASLDSYAASVHARIHDLDLVERFEWAGFVDEPAAIMSSIDVLVHPADAESFGRIAVEAMAASVPVVGVRGGGVAEIVDHGITGYVADVDDAPGLARFIEVLVKDAALRVQLGTAGRRRAQERFSLAAHAAHVIKIYEQVISLHRDE